jgi:hypothetical protein
LLSALWFASSADAQLLLMREHERQMDSLRLGVGIDAQAFFGYRKDAGYSFVQPTALASFRFRELVVEAAMPFGYFHQNNDPGRDRDRFAPGNPWFALLYLPDCECGLSRLSLGMGVPLAQGDSDIERSMVALGRGVNGDWDGYLWLPNFWPLVAGASTRKEIRWLRLVWDADVILGLPGGGRQTEFGAQMAGEADFLFGWQTTLGLRAWGVIYPTLPGDMFQSAMMAYLRYTRPNDSFAARFTLNFDPPAGFSFSRDGMWGAGLLYARSFF